MRFNALAEMFLKYLKANDIMLSDSEKDNSALYIFNHAKELNNYLVSEFGENFSTQSVSISDLLKIKSSDDMEDSSSEQTEGNNDINYFMSQMFNSLSENSDFISAIDINHDNNLSEEEKKNFFKTIQNMDGNASNLSISDILSATDAIKQKKFSMKFSSEDNIDTTVKKNEDTQNEKIQDDNNTNDESTNEQVIDSKLNNEITKHPVDNTNSKSKNEKINNSGRRSNLYNNNNNNINDNNTNTNTNLSKFSKNKYSSMTKEQLQEEKTKAEDDYTKSKKELDKTINIDADEGTENEYNAYKEGLDAISPELGSKLQQYVSDISSQEKIVNESEKNYLNSKSAEDDAKNQVTISEKDVENATNVYNAVKSSLDSISNKDQPDLYKTLQKQEKTTKKALDDAKQAYTNAKENLEKQTKQREDNEKKLKDDKSALQDLNDKKTAFENEIKNNKEYDKVTSLMDNYNNIKAEKIQNKEKLIATAKENVEKSQSALNEIKQQIATRDREAPLFLDKNSKITMKYINDGRTIPYLLIGPKEPQENLPMLVYLHGGKERKKNEAESSARNLGPGGVMGARNWKLDNFNGYIACPVRTGNYTARWASDTGAKYVKDLINTFTSEHSVNQSKIAIAGHSLGGWGAQYIAGALKGTFCKAAALSPSRAAKYSPSDLGIPFRVYVGTDDGENCKDVAKSYKNIMKKNDIIWYKNTAHAGVPRATLTQDSNKNGKSDFFEWLFS